MYQNKKLDTLQSKKINAQSQVKVQKNENGRSSNNKNIEFQEGQKQTTITSYTIRKSLTVQSIVVSHGQS